MVAREKAGFKLAAQVTKAWKLITTLRAEYSGVDDATLMDTLGYFDDKDWDRLRKLTARRLGGCHPTTSPGSCTVSRDVKRQITQILTSKIQTAAPNKDVFG